MEKIIKKCFKCQRTKLLFLFGINHTKHSIASDKGRCIECRKCTAKRFIHQQGSVVELVDKKHKVVTYDVNLKNIIKIYLQIKI
jgi:hypothetical protein